MNTFVGFTPVSGSFLVMGDFSFLMGQSLLLIAADTTIADGLFGGTGMVIGGNLTLSSEFTGHLGLLQPLGYLGNENDIAKFSGVGFRPVFAPEDQVAEFRDAFDTYLCSSYNQLWVTEDTCTATLDADGVLSVSILNDG
eukprot:Selendium_serpulae@DN9739_c0_g1_i1.p1